MINEIELLVCDKCNTAGVGDVVCCLNCGEKMKLVKFKREFVNHCVPVNGVHAPFCTGHSQTDHQHEYLNDIFCVICGHSLF